MLQKLKKGQHSTNQTKTKLKTQNVTKLKNSKCDQTQKLKM